MGGADRSCKGPESAEFLECRKVKSNYLHQLQPTTHTLIEYLELTLELCITNIRNRDMVGAKCIRQLRPYTRESTASRPISKVKLVMAWSVLSWGTGREYHVL